MRELSNRYWWRAEAPAPAWLAALPPHAQVAAAASFEPGITLSLAYDASGQEALCVRAEYATPAGVTPEVGERGVVALRGRLARAAAPNSLRPVPLADAPDAAALEALAVAVEELATAPGAAAHELEPALRGFEAYSRDDGSFQIGLDGGANGTGPGGNSLPFCELRATAGGGSHLSIPLGQIGDQDTAPECADAASLAALRAAGTAHCVGARADSKGEQLVLAVDLDDIDAHRIALGVCSLEHAALGCAREVTLLVRRHELAVSYLALGAIRFHTRSSGSGAAVVHGAEETKGE